MWIMNASWFSVSVHYCFFLASQLFRNMVYVTMSVFDSLLIIKQSNRLPVISYNILPFCPPASRHRCSSDPHSESNRQCQNSAEMAPSGFQRQSKIHSKAPVGISTEQLSANIQGILDDLQLECKAAENEERARQRSRGGSSGRRGRGGSRSRTRTPVSTWRTTGETGSSSRGCRSASPTRHRPETANMADAGHKKRHYDADTVREYIARQQEERKRHQAEEKRALREEAERRNQRLQELYRKQREVAKTVTLASEAPVAPVQKRLQETYNKLLLEEAQLGDTAMQTHPAAPSSQMVCYIVWLLNQ